MNYKDFLYPLTFVFLLTYGMQYFFGPKVKDIRHTQEQTQVEEPAPINKEIEFTEPKEIAESVAEIQTSYGHLEFSSFGGCLKYITYNRHIDNKSVELTTVVPPAEDEKWQNFFLIACDESAPYVYTPAQRVDKDDRVELTYQAHNEAAQIVKKFTIYKNKYQIDLNLTIDPRHPVRPRIFFPSPLLQGSTKSEHVGAIIQEIDQSMIKYTLSRDRRKLHDMSWDMLALFGNQDRYFAHVLFNDQNHFVQRGYYKVDTNKLVAIIQGPLVKKQTSWNLSFYVGPKEHEALNAVDSRLEILMDFGWLGFICKPMLNFMKWVNTYVHNFGIAIIILTILIRLLMIPLTYRGSQAQKKSDELQKKLAYIKQKYKHDAEGYAREQAELYKKYGLGGLGNMLSGGCLPLLLQGPVFFAMNRVLTSSIELYQVPFLWIPDLSAADPYYIMPVLVTLSMWVSTLAIPSGQQRIQVYVMGLILGAFSVGFSSGLALYFAVGGFFGVIQMYIQKLV